MFDSLWLTHLGLKEGLERLLSVMNKSGQREKTVKKDAGVCVSTSVASVRLCCLEVLDTILCLNQRASSGPIKWASGRRIGVPQRLLSLFSCHRAAPSANIWRNQGKSDQAGVLRKNRGNRHFPHLEYAYFPPRTPSPTLPFQFLPSSTGENHSVPCHPANV